jgi:hypothetical protein
MTGTSDWSKYVERAKILVVGHDPRLQTSDTKAEFCFFADYYFEKKQTSQSDKRKFSLAESLFDQIRYITCGHFDDKDVYITNLCNDTLPKPPSNHTVYIPRKNAQEGLENIREILSRTNIQFIFPMSMQVNYWLQELGFYYSENGFADAARPREQGINNKPPYYKETTPGQFVTICGNCYKADRRYMLYPILHTKNYPLKDKFLKYKPNYDRMREGFATGINLKPEFSR